MTAHAIQSDPAAARRELCSRLFAEPPLLIETLAHEVRGRFVIEPHVHDELLQLDLLVDCGGRAYADGQWRKIEAITALATPPGDLHGYVLVPGGRSPYVYHVKLRCRRSWPAVRRRAFLPILTGLRRAEALVAALRIVVQLGYIRQTQPPALIPRLAEALCRWPLSTDDRGGPHAAFGTVDELPAGIAAAVKLIDDRLDDPPALSELAAIAHLSPRHFSRQFEAQFGCTAHAYATARRYAAARELLLGSDLRIHAVADRLGFGSAAIFSRWFSKQGGRAGLGPRAYRESPTAM